MGKDDDKNIWESIGYGDYDHDGDVDLYDVNNEDDDFETIKRAMYQSRHRAVFSEDEYDDEECDEGDNDNNDDIIWCKKDNEVATLREIREQGKEQIYDLFKKASDDDVKDFYWDAFDVDSNKEIKEALGEKRYKELLASIEKRLYGSKLYLKYHDGKERYVYYDCLVQALLDYFDELCKDYDEESEVRANELVVEVFDLNAQRATKYFEWLLKTFPIQELKKIKTETADKMVQALAVDITNRLMDFCSATDDDFMVKYIKDNPHLTENYFCATQWKKHSLFELSQYMKYFESYGEYEMSKSAYALYLKHQVGRYTMRDLGKYWGGHINGYAWRIDDELYDFFEEVLDSLGEYSKAGRRCLKNLERKSQTDTND